MDADQRDEIRVDGRPMRWPSIVVASAAILIAVVLWRNPEDAAASLDSGRAPVAVSQDASQAKSSLALDEVTQAVPSPETTRARTTSEDRATRTSSIPKDAEPLWTATWVNVRERPGPEGPVLRVLTPGQRVLVADPTREWSAAYVGNERIGYVWVRGLAKHRRSD